MSGHQPRFSRKFLTTLMIVLAITIILLSRTGNPPESDKKAEETEQKIQSQ